MKKKVFKNTINYQVLKLLIIQYRTKLAPQTVIRITKWSVHWDKDIINRNNIDFNFLSLTLNIRGSTVWAKV